MPSLDNGYKHWTGEGTSVWQRRWAITSTGLRLCLQGRLLRGLIIMVWATTLFFMSGIFFIGQLTSPDSTLIGYLGATLGEDFTKIANGLASWVVLYPEICVDGVYRVTYFAATQIYTVASFIAISLFIAKLIAHDLASQAIVIYNSKALTRFDYLIGKFGIVFIILCALWLVPIISLWLFGNLMSPDWSFFIHSFKALTRALSVAAVAILSLSLVAMAISALARKTSVAVSLWIVIWIISGMVGTAAQLGHRLGGYISLAKCLDDYTWATFRLDKVWENATTMLPFFNMIVKDVPQDIPEQFQLGTNGVGLPLFFIALYSLAAALILKMRIKSE